MFVKYDPGLGHPRADLGDCTVRSLCVVTTLDYGGAWRLIYSVQGELRLCGFDLPKMLRDMPSVFGVKRRISLPSQKGRKRATPVKFCELFPKGRYILRLAGHVVAVRDGHYYDTWDCGKKCVYCAWEML